MVGLDLQLRYHKSNSFIEWTILLPLPVQNHYFTQTFTWSGSVSRVSPATHPVWISSLCFSLSFGRASTLQLFYRIVDSTKLRLRLSQVIHWKLPCCFQKSHCLLCFYFSSIINSTVPCPTYLSRMLPWRAKRMANRHLATRDIRSSGWFCILTFSQTFLIREMSGSKSLARRI